MTGDKSLVISAAIHKAYIDLDENGTEAAAATAVIMEMATAMAPQYAPPPPIVFTADHPFLFSHPGQRERSHPLHGPRHRPDEVTT